MELVREAIKEAFGNFNFLYLYLVCFVLGLIFMSKRRKLFLVPSAIITIAVLTPQFYDFWNELNGYAYWRTLWIIPIIPVVAAVPAVLVEKSKHEWLKPIVIIASLCVISLCGSYIYKNPMTTFKKAFNKEKLPYEVCVVGDRLLELEDYPCVVADAKLSVYLRQYSGKIYMPYGREVGNGSPGTLGSEIYTEVSRQDGDMDKVARFMLNYGYDYLVTADVSEIKLAALEQAGFEFIDWVEGYGIYKVTGTPTEIRTYNDKHLVASVTTVDEDGNPVMSSAGYATILYEYDVYGRITYEFHLDAEGNPIADASGKAGYRCTRNHLGNILSETNLGVDGEPVIVGYATRKCEYNKKHMLIKELFYDTEGKPMLKTDTYYAVRTISYNKDKEVTGERYYDTEGKLIISAWGYAGYDREIDKANGVVIDRYIGIDGNYMTLAEGYAAIKLPCDKDGNIIGDYYNDEAGLGTDEVYLDIEGNETLRRQGYSRVHRTFNDDGRAYIYSFYAYDNPFVTSGGYSSYKRDYDGRGNVLGESYFGLDGAVTTTTSGFAHISREYDNNNRLSREYYLDEEMWPAYVSSGITSYGREYNEYGDIISETYYDDSGKLTTLSAGFDEVKWEYNQYRQLVKESYYADGKPVLRTDRRFAYFTREYDKIGNLVAERYFDIDGNPVLCDGNYASFVREYNDLRQIVAEYYLDEQGDAISCSGGYARVERKYDRTGRIIEENYYDTDGNPVLIGTGYAGIEREYDRVGNLIEERYYDTDGNPVLTGSGYASIKWTYNEMYQLIKESYYDEFDNPVMIADGYAAWEREYDDRNNVVLIKYLDENGDLTIRSGGYAAIGTEYDERSYNVKELYYDTDMNRIENEEGWSGVIRNWSYAGDVVFEQLIDNSDKPVVRPAGYTNLVREYDASRRLIKESYQDKDGKPADLGGGYCGYEVSYDKYGNIVLMQCFDKNGKQCMGTSGYAKQVREFDGKKLVKEAYYDADDNLVNGESGYAEADYNYDTDGKLALISYYDASGNELMMGSSYMHEYLSSLKDRDITVFISIKDEGTVALTSVLLDDLASLGVKEDLNGKARYSYYAVINLGDGEVIEKLDKEQVSYDGKIGDASYSIISAGFDAGNQSSIVIDGIEYTKNARGMNVVIYDNQLGEVVESLAFDTYANEMWVTR